MHGNPGAHSRSARRRRVTRTLLALSTSLSAALTLAFADTASATSFGAAGWGYNGSGQLGNGTTTLSRAPVPVPGLSDVIAVAAGGEHSLALLGNNTMMAWGNNREGQLGLGSTANSHVPTAITSSATLPGTTAIAAGQKFSLALLKNGTVLAWGANEEGQLGNGKTAKVTSPAAVKGLSGVTAIAAGAEFGLALLSNGTVMAWGAGGEGQLGNGKKSKATTPVAVKGLSGVTAIAAGGEFALARLSSGKVMAWGSNQAAQLGALPEIKHIGEGETEEVEVENSAVPVEVQALAGVTAVAAGIEHSLALVGGGEVMAWGGNGSDQLGNGTAGGKSNMPTAVQGLSGVTTIAAGAHHSLAVLSGGSVVGWGYNPDGQLGNGSNLNSPVPVAAGGLGQVMGVAGGGSHSLSFGPPPPSIGSVSPASGPQAGGTPVTITGAGFGEASAVHFGTAPASFTVDSATSITATAPAGSGTVDVTVTTPVSTSVASASDHFAYVPPPTVTKVKPSKGPAAGGTHVTITGVNLTGATAVFFGAAPAAGFAVHSPSSVEAVSPAATSGPVDITVTTPSGTSALSVYDVFKYEAPTIASLTPNAGPMAGGTSVTVSGSGFAVGSGVTAFRFGRVEAASVQCSSTSSCTFVTPPAKKAGVIEVKAVVGESKSKLTPPADQFTYE